MGKIGSFPWIQKEDELVRLRAELAKVKKSPRGGMAERFADEIVMSDGCWLLEGKRIDKKKGYARIQVNGKYYMAHRFFYEVFKGPIPKGLTIDHLCRHRNCVNPKHLEAVTIGENVRRGEPANRTHCPRGHAYTIENTAIRNGKRHCRECERMRWHMRHPKD